MQLIFHGAAQEVGRSCIEIKTGGDRYLLDCGLKFHEAGFDYPAKVFEVKEMAAVFLSHAHLDHSGGLPFFLHYRMLCPVFCMPETKQITEILLKDSHKIARIKHMHEAFDNMDLNEVSKRMELVRYNYPTKFRGVEYTFYNAGHIPGSASVKVKAEGLTVLYTGDYNTRTTELMVPSDPHSWGEIDVMITETTYGARDLPDRAKLQVDFIARVEEVLRRGGRVLIPVFAVGRAQEILIMLAQKEWPVPIYLDGMAKKVTHVVIDEKSPYVKHRDALNKLMSKVQLISSEEHRDKIAEGPGIFVSTSGMLQGGPAIHYLEHMWMDKKSAVFLTGYQVKGTNGWLLDNEHLAYIGGYRTRVQCEVERFDFSGHLSSQDIKDSVLAARPKILILNHGNRENENSILEWAKTLSWLKVFAPEIGEEIDIAPDCSSVIVKSYTEGDNAQYIDEHQHSHEDHSHHSEENDE